MPSPPRSALEIIGILNIDSAKTKIDAGVANLIRVSLSMTVKISLLYSIRISFSKKIKHVYKHI